MINWATNLELALAGYLYKKQANYLAFASVAVAA